MQKKLLPNPIYPVHCPAPALKGAMVKIAGWSSQVARQAHNLKVVGSNPTPATNEGRLT